jgi:hypothetical protein
MRDSAEHRPDGARTTPLQCYPPHLEREMEKVREKGEKGRRRNIGGRERSVEGDIRYEQEGQPSDSHYKSEWYSFWPQNYQTAVERLI